MRKVDELLKKMDELDIQGDFKGIQGLTQKIIDVALEEKSEVRITYNDEAGKFLWSVVIEGTDFWINSFDSEADAVSYCEEKELRILSISII